MNHPVLHLVPVDHQDGQHPVSGQRQELDAPQNDHVAPGNRDDARHVGQLGKQCRRRLDQIAGVALSRRQFPGNLLPLLVTERLWSQQRIDEVTVPLCRRHAPGRRMRRGHKTQIVEVGQDIADRGRRQIQARGPRQCAAAHRLAVVDIALDDELQQGCGARIEDRVHAANATSGQKKPSSAARTDPAGLHAIR
jgi:hypothetical protein